MKKFFQRGKQPCNENEKKVEQREVTAKTRAVLIGINYFDTGSELHGCINDVNNVYRWLTRNCGYDPSEIRVLTDEEHVPDQYRPTKDNILSAFKWLHSIIPEEGEASQKHPVKLFVHYSGHGSWSKDRNGSGAKAEWQFTTPDARIKLKHLYPKILK